MNSLWALLGDQLFPEVLREAGPGIPGAKEEPEETTDGVVERGSDQMVVI